MVAAGYLAARGRSAVRRAGVPPSRHFIAVRLQGVASLASPADLALEVLRVLGA